MIRAASSPADFEMVEGNTAMRAVNRALGFVELPAWVVVER